MRQVCEGSDVANVVVFLASDNCRLLTGAIIPVDGGLSFGNILDILNFGYVDLSQNPLTTVTRISSLPIQTLNLSNCEITTLEDASFGPLIPEKGLVPFEKVRYLSLAYNDLHSLPQDVFTFMSGLTTLDLSGNPLAFIDQVTMAAITDLELYLSGCELETLPEGMFRRQRRLRRLDLSDNRFTTVPAVLSEAANLLAIKNLTKLQDLRLCRNSKLQNISAGALGGLPNLVSLHICYNPRLTVIDPDFLSFTDDHDVEIWPTLTELTAVDATSNPYTCDCKNQWAVDVLVPMLTGLGTHELAGNMM
ncbi:Leucine-rich transmembrane protein [Operophtera brumata]|uniref:Leucine-rich transmembrane protein n=1 Tax=Operophtera brumata TaxID=104452 RepID=A0A0L7L4W6_OPEBR|nr:Leucine-rich transmembrane protein [Operophtera brumata]